MAGICLGSAMWSRFSGSPRTSWCSKTREQRDVAAYARAPVWVVNARLTDASLTALMTGAWAVEWLPSSLVEPGRVEVFDVREHVTRQLAPPFLFWSQRRSHGC